MDANELRAKVDLAADRRRADWGATEREDAETLADAYLREHPADDGEPVTEDWLRAVGFERNYGYDFRLPGGAEAIDLVWQTSRLSLAHRTDEWCDLPGGTRGDVRRLCRALGIPLKERE